MTKRDRLAITSQMIKAGIRELFAHISDDTPRILTDEEIVEKIFTAMVDAAGTDKES